MKIFQTVLGAAAIVGLTAGVGAAQDKEKIVDARQDQMKQQGRELVAVRNWFQDKTDQAAALAGIEAARKGVAKVPDLFPAGTAMGETSVQTRAKPEIWKEHDKFVAADKKVDTELASLEAAVKSGDKAKAEAVFKEVNFCDSCHQTFRAPAR